MGVLKIGIVEDEMIIAETISLYLNRLEYEVLFMAFSFDDAIKAIDAEKPDLLLLDIKLGTRKNGIDLAAIILKEYKIPFIFLTANSDAVTIQKAKHVKPLAFMVKPFTQTGLFSSIEIAMSNYEMASKDTLHQSDHLFIKVGYQYRKIFFTEILYLETCHNYIKIFKQDGTEDLVRKSMAEILELLPVHQFSKISRYHIVNHQHLQEIKTNSVFIHAVELAIGKSNRDVLLKKLCESRVESSNRDYN